MNTNISLQIGYLSSFKKYTPFIFGGLIVLFVLILSLPTLTTKPRVWTDEAVSIELSRSFSETGTLDVRYAPGHYTGFGYLLQSTGYPITVPLGILFKVFGFSFTLARLYMLGWMLAVLAALFFVCRKFFDQSLAFFSVLLIASFASFYANGRTVVGEVPGFLFLILGLYFWLEKKSYAFAGIFAGLAIVAKPSVFLLIVPAILLVLLREPRHFLSRAFLLALGSVPAGIAGLALVSDRPFSSAFWQKVFGFFSNPYSSDISANIAHNIGGFLHSTTLIYFSILFLLLLTTRFMVRRQETVALYDFVLIYSALAFLYYLRSPGWLRYIFIAELLILTLLPHSIFTMVCVVQKRLAFARVYKVATATTLVVCSFAILQMLQMQYVADIYTSEDALVVAHYLDETYRDKSVAVIDNANLYALLQNPRREEVLALAGVPVIGTNPLHEEPLPQVVVSSSHNPFRDEASTVLAGKYRFVGNHRGFDIFERTTSL